MKILFVVLCSALICFSQVESIDPIVKFLFPTEFSAQKAHRNKRHLPSGYPYYPITSSSEDYYAGYSSSPGNYYSGSSTGSFPGFTVIFYYLSLRN